MAAKKINNDTPLVAESPKRGRPKGSTSKSSAVKRPVRPKRAGRPAGAKNKKTVDLRKGIQQFAEANFEEVTNAWKRIMEPDKKVKAYVDMVKFVLPALQSTKHDFEDTTSSVKDIIAKLQGGNSNNSEKDDNDNSNT